ncbi:MAG: PD40 domain-containing protein [Chitinispirillaceae bacterium]|nr:PD40 domain-containing protein [Chitinispirillaceae bacterium]
MKNPAFFTLLAFLFLPVMVHAKNQVHTEHYIVVFDDGNEFFANEAITVAEEVWDELALAYNVFEDYQKIYVYILDPGDNANGYAIPAKNTVTIYTTNLNAGIRGTSNWIRNVMTHELAHVFSIKAASKNMLFDNFTVMSWSRFRNPDWSAQARYWNVLAPSWWVEGIAQYEAYRNRNDFWDTHRDMFLRMASLENDLLDYVEMGVYGNRNGFYEEMVYNQGFSLVLFIDSLFGRERVRQSARAKSWFNFDGSLKKATGKSGRQLYDMWKKALREKYGRAVAPVQGNVREGSLYFDGGFWDQFPSISPDDERCAFVSNRGFDVRYTHLYVWDKRAKVARRLLPEDKTVDSRIQWFPDAKSVLYSRWNKQAAYLDLYRCYINRKTETPITWHARAMDPALSRDGKTIAYIENRGGMQNLMLIDGDGRNRRQLTNFANGTQLFSPCWTPDGKHIVLGIFNGADRDIAMVNADAEPLDKSRKLTDTLFFPESLNFAAGLGFRLLVHSTADERDPCLSPDGKTLYFSSDRTGIFNIYRMDLAAVLARDTARAAGQDTIAPNDSAVAQDSPARPDSAPAREKAPARIDAEQITNVLGGAFHPSIDRDNARIYFTGFHAADYSIYSIPSRGFQEVVIHNVERDYRTRTRSPYCFASGADDGTRTLRPYQYTLSPYKPAYTMWDVSPFVSFSPAYITDSVGDAHIKGGMQFLLGELSGHADLMGFVYGGKSPTSSAGLSWGIGAMGNIRLPKIMGQNRTFQPRLSVYGTKDQIREEDPFTAEPLDASLEPAAGDIIARTGSGPDTLISKFLYPVKGSFSYRQTFDEAGIQGGLQLDRHHLLFGDFAYRNVRVDANIINLQRRLETRVYTLPHFPGTDGAKDLTQYLLNSSSNPALADHIRENTRMLDTLTWLDYYHDFTVYNDFLSSVSWRCEHISPAQVIAKKARVFNLRYSLINSAFNAGVLRSAGDTIVETGNAAVPLLVINKTVNGEQTGCISSVLQRESFSRAEVAAVERFPLFGRHRHLGTFNAFFGSCDRKLPEYGSVYPLEYRAGSFLSAYPYSFDPIDTGTVIDSFMVYRWLSPATYDSLYLTSTRKTDTDRHDLLAGNRIMYLNAEYTYEIIRGLTFKPLGLLVQGIYATGFAEAAGVWNVDLRESTLSDFLGMGPSFDPFRIGKSYLKDAGLRLEIPFVLFENWRGFFAFSWARRLSLDGRILRIEYETRNGALLPSKIWRLDKNRFSFDLYLSN